MSAPDRLSCISDMPAAEAAAIACDAEVEVTAIVDGSRLPVAALLSLGRGDLVALAPQDDTAVALHLDGRLMARGSLVVSDGRLCVRLTEIVGPLCR